MSLDEILLSPARQMDELLTSGLLEVFSMGFLRPVFRERPVPPEPEEETENSEEYAESPSRLVAPSLPPSPPSPLPAPQEAQRTEVTREVLRAPCRYCGTLTDPIQNPKCPSCGGRPI